MSHTERLSALQGHARPDTPAAGRPTRVWAADVTVVNPDGTVDCQPVMTRGSRVGVTVPAGYKPTVGDRVLVTDLNGDKRTPIVLSALSITPPVVTGSKGGNAALASLISALASLGLITDHTT